VEGKKRGGEGRGEGEKRQSGEKGRRTCNYVPGI